MFYPVEEGGLGIRKFKDMISAFSYKLWWRFRERDSLWANFMHQRYCSAVAPAKARLLSRPSPTWRRMVVAGKLIQPHIRWVVGKGEIHFWEDVWLADCPLSELCTQGVTLPELRVRNLWTNLEWNRDKISRILGRRRIQTEVIDAICNVPIDEGGRDLMRWAPATTGDILRLIWNNSLSPSVSIFIWRLLADRLPLDAKLQHRGFNLASKCRCCPHPKGETRNHLFVDGGMARGIWDYFSEWFPGIPTMTGENSSVEQRICYWYQKIGSAPRDHVSILVSCLVMWHIWLERNNVIHQGAKCLPRNIITRVEQFLQRASSLGKMGEKQWAHCSPLTVDFRRSDRRTTPAGRRLIAWRPPQPTWIKINLDGAILVDSNKAGGGGIVRNSEGTLLRGFWSSMSDLSVEEVKLKELLKGLYLAFELGEYIWIEMDDNKLVGMLRSGSHGAAATRHTVTKIRNLLNKISFKASHIPKEGNQIASWLAARGCNEGSTMEFGITDAPPMVKAQVRLEQSGLSHLRE